MVEILNLLSFALKDLTNPEKVVNPVATVKDSTILITWSPAVDNIGIAHYLLYKGTSSGFKPGNPFAVISDTFYVQPDFVLEQKYYYCIAAVDSSGNTGQYSDEIWAMISEIKNSNTLTMPHSFFLYQNYPNPFNPSTTIQYQLPKSTHIRLIIYNLMGQKVISLVDESQPAGVYRVEWDGKDSYGRLLASGVYVYTIKANDWQDVKKMVLLK